VFPSWSPLSSRLLPLPLTSAGKWRVRTPWPVHYSGRLARPHRALADPDKVRGPKDYMDERGLALLDAILAGEEVGKDPGAW
jgi:hypothetical protein